MDSSVAQSDKQKRKIYFAKITLTVNLTLNLVFFEPSTVYRFKGNSKMLLTRDLAASISGYISIVFWLIVFIPQLEENFKRKSGDGISLPFLITWLVGDFFSLAGVIMERLMFTMFLLALWYTISDLGLIWQVIYYKHCITTKIKHEELDEAISLLPQSVLKQRRSSVEATVLSKPDTNSPEKTTASATKNLQNLEEPFVSRTDSSFEEGTSYYDNDENIYNDNFANQPKIKPMCLNTGMFAILIVVTLISCYGYEAAITQPIDKTKGSENTINVLPQIFGWLSAILYIGSRIPQLVKNYKDQSTEGLSVGMFVCAVFGNIFYTMSIFLKSTERIYIIRNLSWIIGSAGTIIFDIMIFLQFYAYNRRKVD
ncbi:PQ loop repeat-domain-containing protein [Mycotypha africana]|uniref:PQ loop repeat-domain-containing protein n=1 Tax=Mycotypha africana TaxID=64632 RepID=UPI0023009FAA|nr:PQ loop repeat-domain-containing protein [Mycotypha africana]KAI8991456.1 PQ loop repeat-domain-containing protein [Mycotypha africana]